MNTFVIIPYFQGAHVLSVLLKSLEGERSSFTKIIVVDDTPNCKEVEDVCKKYSCLELLRNNENLGFGRTCNRGVDAAIKQGATHLLLINQDTKAHPGLVQKLVEKLSNNKKIYITAPLSCDYLSDEIEPFFIDWYLHKSHDLIQDLLAKRMLKGYYLVEEIHGACIAFRSNLIKNIGLFDPIYKMYSEDRDFCRRVGNCRGKVALIPEAKISHLHSHASGLSEEMFNLKYQSDLIYILKNPKAKFSTHLKKAISFFLKSAVEDIVYLRLKKFFTKIICLFKVLAKTKLVKESRKREKKLIRAFNKKTWPQDYDAQISTSRSLLKSCDNKIEIPNIPGEIRLFAHVRNEELRLPYFFDYYKRLGVDRFFVVDNGSTDKTLEILQSQKNVHIFQTAESMKHYNVWLDILLKDYGSGHWCIVADADEIFTFPGSDKLSLKEFCAQLDSQNENALHCMLLDMYADKPIYELSYRAGDDPFAHCSYFDPQIEKKDTVFAHRRTYQTFRINAYHGGMRERVFKEKYNMSKVPLVKYSEEILLGEGHHVIAGAKLAKSQGVVFHFKFFQDFIERSIEEAKREEHFMNAADYKRYARVISQDPMLNLHYAESRKYENLEQLEKLGFINRGSSRI